MDPIKSKSRWARLALGVVTLLFSGIIYSWSLIKAPFDSFEWSSSALTLNYTLTMCFFCLGGFVSGLLSKKLSMRVRMIAAAVLVLGGFGIVSAMGGKSILPLYVGYGFMTGSGIGVVYNVVISATNAWFPDRKGLSSGALMMGFGFTTLTLGNLFVKLFDVEALGWRRVYFIYGAILAVIFLVQAFVLKMPESRGKAASDAGNDMTASQMIRRFSFWKLFVFFALFAAVGSTAIAGAKGQFADLGAVGSAAVLAGLLTVCNGLGRIVSGAFFDRFGRRKTQYLTSAVVIAATALTLLGYAAELTVVGCIGLCLCGFSYGFSPTISAAFAAEFYGSRNFALNFSILNLILIPASFVPTLLSSLNGTWTFAVLVIFSLVGLGINLTVKKS
ncbi:MAG: MFS transporter [Clostridia bacterium]|nr:MFS transporter [Clostridia bacterium]